MKNRQRNWTISEIEFLKEYYPLYGSKFVANKLQRSINSVKKFASRMDIRCLVELREKQPGEELEADFETAKNKFEKLIKFNKAKLAVKNLSVKNLSIDNKSRILIMGCLHIPFHSENNLAKVIAWAERNNVDTIAIAGDLMDCISVCHGGHRRNMREEDYVPLKQELMAAKVIINDLATKFNKVILMQGNHVERVRKFFAERVGPELLFLVNHNILNILADGYNNVEVYEGQYGEYNLCWLMQIGDIRIAHAEINSSREFGPSVKLEEKFYHWDSNFYDLTNGYLTDWNVIVELHTHQAGYYVIDSGRKLVIEGSCLTKTKNYSISGSANYKRPQSNAVTYLEQTNGITDINSFKQLIFPCEV